MHYRISLPINFVSIPRGSKHEIVCASQGRRDPVGNVGSVKRQTGLAHPGKLDRQFDGWYDGTSVWGSRESKELSRETRDVEISWGTHSIDFSRKPG